MVPAPLSQKCLLLFCLILGVPFLHPLVLADDSTKIQANESPASKSKGSKTSNLGLFFKAPNSKNYEFFTWQSEGTINGLLWLIRNKPGAEIHFAPGTYEINQRIIVDEVPDLRVSGSPGVKLVFSEVPIAQLDRNTKPVHASDRYLHVENPDRFKTNWRYQIFAANGLGDRLLEFTVKQVLDDRLEFAAPARFMPHVSKIPAHCQIIEQVNFFRIKRSPNFVLENIEMDGRNRGKIRGHTTYCGVYASGNYKEHERPTTMGMQIRGCTFKNLKGRGVAFYGLAEVLIENNHFENIRAQAIEIDHYSSGVVRGNDVDGAEVGVMINDAFDSLVEANTLINCNEAVKFLRILEDDWTNTGTKVQHNLIGPGCRAGVRFFGSGMHGNLVRGNRYFGLGKAYRVMNPEGNTVEFLE